jgi:hypothetical protein
MKSMKNAFVLVCLLAAPAMFAQATRTWVSGVGDDANPCSRTAPCKTFAGAISKTATAGEISVLDPGGFGAVTINKSISIDGTGTLAGILFSGTNGIVINGAGANVTLRGLSINGGSTGLKGIRIVAAGSVVVEQCDISNFTDRGISDERTVAGKLTVLDTVIHRGLGATSIGFIIEPTLETANTILFDNVRIIGMGGTGAYIANGARATLRNSDFSFNGFDGVRGNESFAGPTQINVESCVIMSNGNAGIHTAGSPITIRLSNTVITDNRTNGIDNGAGNTIVTFGRNRIVANTGNNGAGMTPGTEQ